MILPESIGGWIALGISLALWAFIIGTVIMIAREEFKEDKKEVKKEKRKESK